MKAKTTKKAFDLARDSVYVAEPLTELCIIGGLILDAEEQGDLDTAPTKDHALKDLQRLREPLDPQFKASIAARGVDTPIRIAKIDGVATVIAGRSRVRAARVANRIRTANGEPLIKIKCVIQRDIGALALITSKIIDNNQRRDDSFPDKLEKLHELLAAGASEEDAALAFKVNVATIRGWLAYADHATPETKAAVQAGRLGATAAAELVRVHDPEQQNTALQALLTAPVKKTVGAARQAARAARAGTTVDTDDVVLTGKRGQRAFLEIVQNTPHPNAGAETMSWWDGVEAAIKLFLGDPTDARLTKLLKRGK